jgi:hypothetical protein
MLPGSLPCGGFPRRESRVCLTNGTDEVGVRRLAIDLRFSVEDAEGIYRAHQVLDAGLRKSGLGCLELRSDAPRSSRRQGTDFTGSASREWEHAAGTAWSIAIAACSAFTTSISRERRSFERPVRQIPRSRRPA